MFTPVGRGPLDGTRFLQVDQGNNHESTLRLRCPLQNQRDPDRERQHAFAVLKTKGRRDSSVNVARPYFDFLVRSNRLVGSYRPVTVVS